MPSSKERRVEALSKGKKKAEAWSKGYGKKAEASSKGKDKKAESSSKGKGGIHARHRVEKFVSCS